MVCSITDTNGVHSIIDASGVHGITDASGVHGITDANGVQQCRHEWHAEAETVQILQ